MFLTFQKWLERAVFLEYCWFRKEDVWLLNLALNDVEACPIYSAVVLSGEEVTIAL